MLLLCWFDHFLDSRAEICQIFCFFFGKSMTPKRHSEINWPLEALLFIHVLSNFLPALYSCLPKQYWWHAVECGRKIHKLSYYQNIFHPPRLKNQSPSYFLCCQIVQASLWRKKLPINKKYIGLTWLRLFLNILGGRFFREFYVKVNKF